MCQKENFDFNGNKHASSIQIHKILSLQILKNVLENMHFFSSLDFILYTLKMGSTKCIKYLIELYIYLFLYKWAGGDSRMYIYQYNTLFTHSLGLYGYFFTNKYFLKVNI